MRLDKQLIPETLYIPIAVFIFIFAAVKITIFPYTPKKSCSDYTQEFEKKFSGDDSTSDEYLSLKKEMDAACSQEAEKAANPFLSPIG